MGDRLLVRGSVRVDSFPDAGMCWYAGLGCVSFESQCGDRLPACGVCVRWVRYALIILVTRWGLVCCRGGKV